MTEATWHAHPLCPGPAPPCATFGGPCEPLTVLPSPVADEETKAQGGERDFPGSHSKRAGKARTQTRACSCPVLAAASPVAHLLHLERLFEKNPHPEGGRQPGLSFRGQNPELTQSRWHDSSWGAESRVLHTDSSFRTKHTAPRAEP